MILLAEAASTGFHTMMIGIMATAVASLAGAVAWLWKKQVATNAKYIEKLEKREAELERREDILEEKIRGLEARLSSLEAEKAAAESRYLILQSSHDSSPIPAWIKSPDGECLAVNKAYAEIFLEPRGYSMEDYLGHTDKDVWPDAIAEEFAKNDSMVFANRKIWDGTETVEMPDGSRQQVRIVKWPRYIIGVDRPIGIAGAAIVDSFA